MLSVSEIRLLSEMSSGSLQDVNLNELADHLDWSVSHVSRVVSRLQERELLQADREGGEKIVRLPNARPIEQFSGLVRKFPHVDFPEYIAGSALRMCYYLDTGRTASELAELSGVNRTTVYRRLESLQHVGIVGKDHSQYALTEPFRPLSEFARSLAHHDHRHEATQLATGVYVIWETLDEYLIGCQSELTDDGLYQTGPAIFERFGIPLLTREQRHYFRTDRLSKITPADLVCHTLLIEDSTRYRSYCLLLIAGQEITDSSLSERANHYNISSGVNLEEIVQDLYTYLETGGNGASDVLPEWKDFQEMAADYNISV